ncbi:hypothetical protein CFOL_v3_15697 [Cephalotus follicularis]|uniref:DUF4283 domain-containing protein n=1 Tax=Cephalotus follicularis TaxID=3775 RepID=A0A1Q3BWH8_CEPFO|nr:hypothetical protein CFOL_v3_15697 [Cephalotus follicularis]
MAEESSIPDNTIPTVLLSWEEKKRIRAPWCQCLVVKVVGRTIRHHDLLFKIHQLWHPQGNILVVDLGSIKFCLKQDFIHLLSSGPWFIGSHSLTIRH